jgi:hypothetical protein
MRTVITSAAPQTSRRWLVQTRVLPASPGPPPRRSDIRARRQKRSDTARIAQKSWMELGRDRSVVPSDFFQVESAFSFLQGRIQTAF